MKTAVIIAAGGAGKRFGQNGGKQLFEYKSKPILIYTLEKFIGLVEQIIVVSPSEDHERLAKYLNQYQIKNITLVSSGTERYLSVKNGLSAVEKDIEAVLVHDGVRPNLSRKLIKNIIESLKKYSAVIPVIPVVDTIKVIKNNVVESTPKRSELFQVQTPQAFHKELLVKAYEQVNLQECTDDAMVVERYGEKVQAIAGELNNIKITNPQDIEKLLVDND